MVLCIRLFHGTDQGFLYQVILMERESPEVWQDSYSRLDKKRKIFCSKFFFTNLSVFILECLSITTQISEYGMRNTSDGKWKTVGML